MSNGLYLTVFLYALGAGSFLLFLFKAKVRWLFATSFWFTLANIVYRFLI